MNSSQLAPVREPSWPVVAAYGAGVDSTAMLLEWINRGLPLDAVLFADTGSEKPETYAYLGLFRSWLADHGTELTVVRYVPQNFKNWPPYYSLAENCLTNGTLPSISFSRHSCSLKWKVQPQEAWTRSWEPAATCWSAGGRVVKLIGYDASPRDLARYAHARSVQADERYLYRYPLIEWGWTRSDCERRIAEAGLPVPLKSSCWMCAAQSPAELEALPKVLLRRIVLMEACAAPRLRNIDGLWRKPVLGRRGAIPRPGSMTQFIRERGLLSSENIDAIVARAPRELVRFRESVACTPASERPGMAAWLRLFDLAAELGLEAYDTPPLFDRAA